MPTNYWLKFGNTPLGYNGSGVQFTHIEQPGTLTVSLVGTGTGFDNTKNFNVLVTFGSAISYTVDGTPVATPSATCTLTLKAGQSSVIGNIPFGTTYNVTESPLSQQDIDDGYSNGSVTGGSGTMTDAGALSANASIVYVARVPGTITVTNSVSIGGSGFDSTKQFGIVLIFSKAITYTVNGTPVSSPSTTCNLSLVNGQSAVIGNIPYKTGYTIAETAMSAAEVAAGYTNGVVTNSSGTMADGGSVSSTANYTYEEPNTAVINGKRYKTTTIDGKVWMAENYTAAVGSHNPSTMPSGAAYWDYADSVLYNAQAVKRIITNPPSGWHIPSLSEWMALFTVAGGTNAAGGKLKSTSGWTNQNGTDDYGFNGKPCGYRYGGVNRNSGTEATWWDSNSIDVVEVGYGTVTFYNNAPSCGVAQEGSGDNNNYAHSIRLVKD